MNRRDYRNLRCPIMRDAIRGFGGIGSGWFTTNGSEGLTYDATAHLLATESGDPIITEEVGDSIGI